MRSCRASHRGNEAFVIAVVDDARFDARGSKALCGRNDFNERQPQRSPMTLQCDVQIFSMRNRAFEQKQPRNLRLACEESLLEHQSMKLRDIANANGREAFFGAMQASDGQSRAARRAIADDHIESVRCTRSIHSLGARFFWISAMHVFSQRPCSRDLERAHCKGAQQRESTRNGSAPVTGCFDSDRSRHQVRR